MYFTKEQMFDPVSGKEHDLIDLYTEYYGEKYRNKIQSRVQSTEFFFLDKNPIETIQTHYATTIQDLLHEYEDKVGFVGATMHSIEDYKNLLISLLIGDMGEMSIIQLADIAVGLGLNFFDYDTVEDFLSDAKNYEIVVNKINECIDVWNREYAPKVEALQSECMCYTEPFREEESTQEDISRYYDDKVDNVYLNYMSQFLDMSHMNIMQVLSLKQYLHSAVSIGKENLNSDYILDPELQKQFISLFKAFGFCYGSDFDAYTKDETLLSIIYNEDLLNQVYTLKKEKYVTSFMHNSQFLEAVDRVNNIDTKSGSYNILAAICSYLSSNRLGGFNQTHLTCDNRIKHICVCPLPAGLSDGVFLHEAGHAIEGEILKVLDDESAFIDKSGIDTLKIDISKLDFSFDEMFKRVTVQSSADMQASKKNHKYQILSEVIHDYFTRDLVELAHSKGLSFGLMQNDKDTAYSVAFDMIGDFIEANKPFLKDCMMSDDPHMLARFLGQDRLDRLAELVEECVLIPDNKRQVIYREIRALCGHNATTLDALKENHKWTKHTKAYLDMYLESQKLLSDYTMSPDGK